MRALMSALPHTLPYLLSETFLEQWLLCEELEA